MLQKRESIRLTEAFKLASLANLLSTFVGFGVGVAYSSSFAMVPGFALGVAMSIRMTHSFLRHSGYLQQHSRLRYAVSSPVLFVVFLLISVGGCYAGMSLLPGGSRHMSPIQWRFSGTSEVFVTVSLVAFLLVAGFVLTVISEGYVVARGISSKRPQVVKTVILMNLLSYVLLFGALGLSGSYIKEALALASK